MKVQRCHAIDTLVRDQEMAVLFEAGTLVRLSDLSAAIFELAVRPVEVETLAAELAARFGAPHGRTSLGATQDAVAELISHGVLDVIL